MTTTFVALQMLLLLPMSWAVGRSDSSRSARAQASLSMLAAGALALAQLAWNSFDLPGTAWAEGWLPISNPHPWVPAFSLISCLMGFTAVSLSPIRETRPKTFRRILLLISVALLFLSVRSPIGLAVLWTASAALTWLELRDLKYSPNVA